MEEKHAMTPVGRGRKRGKGRWSAVDTVILLLVLLAVGGIVYRVVYAIQAENEAANAPMYAVYFEVAETHTGVLAEVRGFDAVYLYENGAHLGYIAVYEDTLTGEYRVALTTTPVEGTSDVTATGCMICTGGTLSGGSLLLSGSEQYLTPGGEVVVYTERALLTLRITEIRPHP